MSRIFTSFLIFGAILQHSVSGQTVLTIYPDSLLSPINVNFTPGIYYVPKTSPAVTDFMGNGIHCNAIRTNIIEGALNNNSNLTSCLAYLASVKTTLQSLSLKCDKFIFVFEKMPPWLSNSTNGSPAPGTVGWYVLNTKPPANWNTWQTVVDSITSKIVTQFGISNAYFEIWNEPDLGSWSGTMNEYFELYKRTYAGIKASSSNNKVGGPAVNFWANNIYWKPPYGYISNTKADSSLIGQLLDSAKVWNKIPDFVSWHNFNITCQEFSAASNYVQQKLASLSLSPLPFVVSEWNANSAVRDTRLGSSFMIKAALEFAKNPISNNVISAWQDLTSSAAEFHNDYGLLTTGAIHKPAYNSILLSQKLNGTSCKMNSALLFDGVSTLVNDTLSVLISNYCPPPFVEAYNNTLYQGHFNVNQLDSAGYVDIATNNPNPLDSIYKGLITLPGSNAMQAAINNSIGIYQHYASIATSPRQFKLMVGGYTGNYTGQLYVIDSTKNNMQFKYDSLRSKGYTQSSAISYIVPIQNLNSSPVQVNSGQYIFSLQPNAVCLFKIRIPGISSVSENSIKEKDFVVYPNPATDKLTIIPSTGFLTEPIVIYNSLGALVRIANLQGASLTMDVSELSCGPYFIYLKNHSDQAQLFIKR